ncbi:MAG: four helix bundle protein [Candidatus Margulisiibacteriota bacterium]
MANYRNLTIWKKADELALLVYRLTKEFPKHELFGITSQLRRAALSAPTNIVEGYNRKSKNELRRFLDFALGSLAEVEYLVGFAVKFGYLPETEELTLLIEETGKVLWSFQKSL